MVEPWQNRLVKATMLSARPGSELALAKHLTGSGDELTLPKLSANVGVDLLWARLLANLGGGFAFDIKGKSQGDFDACILGDPAYHAIQCSPPPWVGGEEGYLLVKTASK
jgi:hypothetical protein